MKKAMLRTLLRKYFLSLFLLTSVLGPAFADDHLFVMDKSIAADHEHPPPHHAVKRLFNATHIKLLAHYFSSKRQEQTNIRIVKEMFSEFAEKKDMDKFDNYHSRNFVLESNRKRYNYQRYKKLQADSFAKLDHLTVLRYKDIFASGNKVVSRMNIELVFKDGKKKTFEVILVAQLKENKIQKIWELTYPNWS